MATKETDERLTVKCSNCGYIFLLTEMIFSTGGNGKVKSYCPKCKKELK